VLAIEAALFESRRNDCIKAGFNGALPPGDSPETLYATVLHWLKHRSGRRTASH